MLAAKTFLGDISKNVPSFCREEWRISSIEATEVIFRICCPVGVSKENFLGAMMILLGTAAADLE